MENNIYISTRAFKDKRLKNILEVCLKNEITNLELGSDILYDERNLDLIFKFNYKPIRFLLHNYFPRPKEDFVLNLASDDSEIISKTFNHYRMAIDISSKLGVPFYSIHAGYAFHAKPEHLGNLQVQLPRIPYRQAYRNFVKNSIELSSYASKKGVKLAVENNVVPAFNLKNGKNKLLLLAEAQETLSFYEDVSSDNLFFLIDLGHLKVNALSLGFDRRDYLRNISPYTIAFHLSDNAGLNDEHLPYNAQVWFKDIFVAHQKGFFIIEVRNTDVVSLKKMISFCEK